MAPVFINGAGSAAIRPAVSQSARSVGSSVPNTKNKRLALAGRASAAAAAPAARAAFDIREEQQHAQDIAVDTSKAVLVAEPEVVTELDAVASEADAVPQESQSEAPSSRAPSVSTLSLFRSPKDHNSVTIKHDTRVKDAAGAIFKVIDRLSTAFVTAIRVENTHEALNRAVKSIAVARKYVNDNLPGFEVTFLPFNRMDNSDTTNPNLFAFLVFKTAVNQTLKMQDQTDLNVSKGSDINKMANAVISIVLDREQAVMKAGGSGAIFVAMSAIINARRRMQTRHSSDIMLVPSFITEDTSSTLGRESKFLRFNILRCEPNGPKSTVHPSVSSYEGPYAAVATPAAATATA